MANHGLEQTAHRLRKGIRQSDQESRLRQLLSRAAAQAVMRPERAAVENRARRASLRNALLAVIAMASIPMSLLVWDTRGHRRNAAAFRRLDIGMSPDEIRKAVRREPDCVVRVSESQVWFYFAKARNILCPAAVVTPAELPRDYASLQILVGPSRRVDAIGFDGETQGVKVDGGLVSGSSIAELPPSLVQ